MSSNKYKSLCFEGGGVKGYAYCGAIKELSNQNILNNISNYAGSSIGAFFAVLLNIGFSGSEVYKLKDELIFKIKGFNCFCSSVYSIWKSYGINDISILEKEFRKVISRKIDPEITLEELYNFTKKELVIVTCNLNNEKAVYLHHSKYPKVKLIEALLASVSVPFVFKPRKYNFEGVLDYYIDGGSVDNYPIWIFNDINKLYNGDLENVEKNLIPKDTLGIKLLDKNENNDKFVFKGRKNLSSIFKYSISLLNTIMLQNERSIISESYIEQTISINTYNIEFSDFNLNKDKRYILVKSGIDAVINYLFNKENEYYNIKKCKNK